MSQPTRRARSRVDTERDIRQHARQLLVEQGHEAVTLRAIARGLGITAPALYRYYSSRAALIEQLRLDICTDLADEMAADLHAVPESDTVEQVRAACRAFRRWSLSHPREFVLFFASLDNDVDPVGPLGPQDWPADGFGQIFLTLAGKVLARHDIITLADEDVPAQLRADLTGFRDSLLVTIADSGVELTVDALGIGTAYRIWQFWVRLYGHVALEVFGRFPYAMSAPEALFEATLSDLMRDIGL
ncbi:MAG: TetR family transcriptional regulator [Pseudonocardiaceae bacterium]|nr:TetR family transcriptional regulator [Pseudonocardiaceae bacterium]